MSGDPARREAGTDDGLDARRLARAPTAGIVATGSELLAGRVHDANGPWIAERLGELGVDVTQILLVGDRPDEMEAALRFLAGAGVDLVVTSGGLGPTADDLTAAVVADVTGRPLELDEHMEKVVGDIIARFADRLRWNADALAEANRKQALVPRGATAIPPAGTAPGLAVPPGEGAAGYAPDRAGAPRSAPRGAGHVGRRPRDRAGARAAGSHRAVRRDPSPALRRARSPTSPRPCARSVSTPT